jgi:hypothetical protein
VIQRSFCASASVSGSVRKENGREDVDRFRKSLLVYSTLSIDRRLKEQLFAHHDKREEKVAR